MLLVAWALGVAVSGTAHRRRSPRWCAAPAVLGEVDRRAARRTPSRCCSPSTTWSAPASSRATSSRSRPSGSSTSRPAPGGCCATPTSIAPRASVLKVRGTNGCGRGVEGTGFLYADDRLMTNAHVVAGVGRPGGHGRRRARCTATVVYYNPDIDIAVLAVDERRAAAPRLRPRAASRATPGAVLGYPQDGPYDVEPARIRAEQRLRSPDIYGDGTVIREVFSLRGAGPPGQLRRPDRVVGGRGARRGLRRVGHRPRHRLRAHRRPGRPGAPPRWGSSSDDRGVAAAAAPAERGRPGSGGTVGPDSALERAAGSACPGRSPARARRTLLDLA